MEFVGLKREKKRKKRRRNLTKKHRDQVKGEVKSSKRKKSTTEVNNVVIEEKKIVTMEANAFWENYKAAHEWQNRHNSTWWKARCFALEHENHLLKENIRDLVKLQGFPKNIIKTYEHKQQSEYHNRHFNFTSNKDEKNINDIFEFQLNGDMMSFLAQSIRHKIELKKEKNAKTLCQNEDLNFGKAVPNTNSLVHKKNEDAKLLYGEATSRILAMETALQTTIEKHKDKSKPQYWPNIPLKF